MRQRITLTPQLRAYLLQYIGISAEQLQIDYWYRVVLQDPAQAPRIYQLEPDQIQTHIHRQAQRRLRRYIRQQLGLPRPSGSAARQRRYHKLWRAHRLRSQKFRF